jgi:hypothetical protein
MSTMPTIEEQALTRRTSPMVAWLLVGGGVFFLAGGQIHPRQDPPGVSLKEHMRIMFEDPAWYPSHAALLVGTALIAASLVALVRGRSLAGVPRVHVAAVIAAIAASLATLGMLLHLVAASDATRIAHHEATPITDVQIITETITVPAFGFSIAALAVIGAATRTLGNPVIAVLGVLGGIGFGLAGGTFLITDRLNFLFPTAVGIALWTIGAGIGLLLRRRATSAAARAA